MRLLLLPLVLFLPLITVLPLLIVDTVTFSPSDTGGVKNMQIPANKCQRHVVSTTAC